MLFKNKLDVIAKAIEEIVHTKSKVAIVALLHKELGIPLASANYLYEVLLTWLEDKLSYVFNICELCQIEEENKEHECGHIYNRCLSFVLPRWRLENEIQKIETWFRNPEFKPSREEKKDVVCSMCGSRNIVCKDCGYKLNER